jgi:hypothetical protein
MKSLASWTGAIAALALSGCANINSIHRDLNLQGKSVALDAKQRAIFSLERGAQSVICAEPSPDALSAFSASLSGTLTRSEGEAAQLAAAMAEQAASIGLRTQSIQLMRDAMYRACEGYMSGGISQAEFHQLQRRFQNLTLGLLAIEQLTGAVKAEQVSLSTNSGAATGENVEVETAALNKAKADQIAAKDEFEKANLQLGKDQVAHTNATAAAAEAQKKLAAIKEPTQADKDAAKAAQDAATAAAEKLEQQKLLTDSRRRTLEAAESSVKVAEQNLVEARGRVRASAGGTAGLGQAGAARAAVAERVASEVHGIVKTVLSESGRNEGCNGIIEDFRYNKTSYASGSVAEQVLMTCLAEKTVQIAGEAQRNKLNLQGLLPFQLPPMQPK